MLLLIEGALSIGITILIVSLLAGLVAAITGERFDPYNIEEGDDDLMKTIKTRNRLNMVSPEYKDFIEHNRKK